MLILKVTLFLEGHGYDIYNYSLSSPKQQTTHVSRFPAKLSLSLFFVFFQKNFKQKAIKNGLSNARVWPF